MRRWAAAVVLTLMAVLLTGCVHYEATGVIDEDGLVSGSVSRGQASVSPYQAGRFQGFKVSFSKVGLDDFTKLMRHEGGSIGAVYRLTRGKDTFVFSAEAVHKPGEITLPKEAFKGAQISLALTFPGEVLTSNGTVDGRTVTWRPDLSTVTKLTATGRATPAQAEPTSPAPTGSPSSAPPPPPADDEGSTPIGLLIVVVAGVLVVLTGAALLLVRRGRS